jgi:hypothetical protein
MKKLIFFCINLYLLSSFSQLFAQKLEKHSVITSYCYAGDKVNRIYIPPPKEFFQKKGIKGGATVKFHYTGFSQTAINAMEYAGSILEVMLPPDVHIDIIASWSDLGSSGILAQAAATGYAPGWGIDAQKPYAFYPAALAEKISGQSLNAARDGDIELYVNSSISWYLGTDGNTPTLKYDLVTVVIHELIHGLGFFDSFLVDATTGSYGSNTIPVIYDTFVEDLTGKKLTDTLLFQNPSAALKSELTSGNLYFNGPLLSTYTSGSRAKLWAPATFDEGSSVSHLDENAVLKINSLMTPYIDRGEAIHDPGKYTFSILADLGWINTRIIHTPSKDTEEHVSEVAVSASIKSDTTYNHNSVGVVWSFDNFSSSDTTYMVSPQSDNNYMAVIPVSGYEKKLEYYLFTEDRFLRTYRSPSFIPKFFHTVYIGIDTVKPVITYTPPDYYFELIDSVRFNAKITDNLGIDTVYIEYKINNEPSRFIGLEPGNNDIYSNALKTKNIGWAGGDSLQYRIITRDKAAAVNQRVLPASGFFSVKVETVKQVQESYSTDFSDAFTDFYNEGFQILKPAGFSQYGLNTPHPYISPEESGDSIGYESTLRVPVVFDGSGMILSYDEEVLVEPGETGSVYGSKYFYDYVIVEGSVDFGRTWFSLTDGYDSRYTDAWEEAYLSSTDEQNSIFIGNESLLRKHTIFLNGSTNLSVGDTLMVRFRIFSDPYANGWGWVIEDLHLGPIIDQVEDIVYKPAIIYPNPGNGMMRIKQPDDVSAKPVRYSVFNTTGTCLLTGISDGGTEFELNISRYPSGLYFIVLYNDGGISALKYSLIK